MGKHKKSPPEFEETNMKFPFLDKKKKKKERDNKREVEIHVKVAATEDF